MKKEKEYVCGYTFCRHKEDKVPASEAVKSGGRYLHPECFKEKETKKQIVDLYYRYYKSTEDYKMVVKAIKTLINEQNYEAVFVLYVLCQCIHEKVPFKGIFSLGWQVKNNMIYKKRYEMLMAKKAVKNNTYDDIECYKDTAMNIQNRIPKKRKTWDDILFGG